MRRKRNFLGSMLVTTLAITGLGVAAAAPANAGRLKPGTTWNSWVSYPVG